MTAYTLLITDDAEEDIKDAVEWYRLVSSNLETQFAKAVTVCLESIRRNPNQYPSVYKDMRRALLRNFPYGIFYFVFDDSVIVQACFHTSRNPIDWQNRL
jgi:plasmid stabilization system protein ParE